MLSGEPYQQSASEQITTNEESQSVPQTLYFLPFAVQLQNIFPIEITARRFPVEIANAPSAQLSISEIQIDAENRHAQAILEIQVSFSEEPRPFEISCKMMGQFAYMEEYDSAKVYQFLEQESLSVMLPFARELLLSLCTRLQIPPIILAMVQLAPPPSVAEANKETNPQEM